MRHIKHTWIKKAMVAYMDEGIEATREEIEERAKRIEIEYLNEWRRNNREKCRKYENEIWIRKYKKKAESEGIDCSAMTDEELSIRAKDMRNEYFNTVKKRLRKNKKEAKEG